mmetsp:Transcript_1896/g.4156  ORF Transcript_1896/g.4156 Transcript_1896/m.4156 type:complete len:213 (+) Transcript_1896:123-761(+)
MYNTARLYPAVRSDTMLSQSTEKLDRIPLGCSLTNLVLPRQLHWVHVYVVLPKELIYEAHQFRISYKFLHNAFLDGIVVNIQFEHDIILSGCTFTDMPQWTVRIGFLYCSRDVEPAILGLHEVRYLLHNQTCVVRCDLPHPISVKVCTLIGIHGVKPCLRSTASTCCPNTCPSIEVVELLIKDIILMQLPLVDYQPVLSQLRAKVNAGTRMS